MSGSPRPPYVALPESLGQLSKYAVALGIGSNRAWGQRRGPFSAGAGAGLARVRGPHGPVAGANAEGERFGHEIGEDYLGLNAVPCPLLREKSDGLPQRMSIQPSDMSVGQISHVTAHPEAIPHRGLGCNPDPDRLPRVLFRNVPYI